MQRQAQCSTASNIDPEIPDSDAIQTDQLWFAVKMTNSEGPEIPATDPTASGAQPVAKRLRTAASTPRSTTNSASIDDTDFESTVLKPRGVEFCQAPSQVYNQVPFQHFGAEVAPKSGKMDHYQRLLSHEIDLFIDGGPEFNERVEDKFTTAESWSLIDRRY